MSVVIDRSLDRLGELAFRYAALGADITPQGCGRPGTVPGMKSWTTKPKMAASRISWLWRQGLFRHASPALRTSLTQAVAIIRNHADADASGHLRLLLDADPIEADGDGTAHFYVFGQPDLIERLSGNRRNGLTIIGPKRCVILPGSPDHALAQAADAERFVRLLAQTSKGGEMT